MKPQPRYQPGDRIGGRYQVHKALMGGMGEVYLCLDLEERIPLALKTFQQRYISDNAELQRAFEQEVAIWIALENHPNIVRCHVMKHFDYQPFMILEWIAGDNEKGNNVADWLRYGPLHMETALEIAIDVCHGLIYAQQQHPGLVHRDLKPANILMTQGGLAKVTDFGLAQIVTIAGIGQAQLADTDGEPLRHFVNQGEICGTPAYMAPEQWCNGSLTEQTDIYALGCILYEMVTGAYVFQVYLNSVAPKPFQQRLDLIRSAHLSAPIPDLAQSFPAALNQLLQTCLAKRPSERPATLSTLLNELTDIYQTVAGRLPQIKYVGVPFTADAYANRGLTYAALKQFEAAIADYDRAIELDRDHAIAHSNRGTALHELAHYEAALADFHRAITLNPQLVQAYSNRGRTYYALRQYGLAINDFNYALTLDPNSAYTYSNRAATYTTMNQFGLALADCNYAIKLDSTFAEAYSNRGNIYSQQGQYEPALADYDRAIYLNPNHVEAYSNRGIVYKHQGNLSEALANYTRAIELNPDFAEAYFNRAMLYLQSERFTEALADFSYTIKLAPTLIEAYVQRGITHKKMGCLAEAQADYERAIELDPTFALAHLNLGVLWAHQRFLQEALACFEQAAQLGLAEGVHYAEETRKQLIAQQAFDVFQQTRTNWEMRAAVVRCPLLMQAEFFHMLVDIVATKVPPEERPHFEQRLAWLRQIIHEREIRSPQ